MMNRVSGGDPLVWVLADDRAGNVSQCRGVADALGLRYRVMRLDYTAAAALPNFLMGASFGGLTADTRINLAPPWPDLIVAAGRRTAPAARHIKNLNGNRTFLAQIMYPGEAGVAAFDLIAVPRHDRMPAAPNMLTVTGAPHGITAQRLASAATAWRDRFADLPAPRIALIAGGGTKRKGFPEATARQLASAVNRMAVDAGGSVLVTTSRRTGAAAAPLVAELTAPAFVFKWGDKGDNPYLGFLALADRIVVTGDSVSMCCEACGTGKPVQIFAPRGFAAHKHKRLHQELFDLGAAQPFGGDWRPGTPAVIDTAARIAEEIRRRFL